MREKLNRNLKAVLVKMKLGGKPRGEQIETLRVLRAAVDDLLYETIQGTAVFSKKLGKTDVQGHTEISRSGFSFISSTNGISIEVLDYHVGRTFLDWDEIRKLKA